MLRATVVARVHVEFAIPTSLAASRVCVARARGARVVANASGSTQDRAEESGDEICRITRREHFHLPESIGLQNSAASSRSQRSAHGPRRRLGTTGPAAAHAAIQPVALAMDRARSGSGAGLRARTAAR